MIRQATPADAGQLLSLNDQFNGAGSSSLEHIRDSLAGNPQEAVFVAEEAGVLVGFACVQLKQSFCYNERYAEISEVFVTESWRRRGVASGLLAFAEDYCARHYHIRSLELHTGGENLTAQALYRSMGYGSENEILLRKRR